MADETKLRELAQEAAALLYRRFAVTDKTFKYLDDFDPDTAGLIALWRKRFQAALDEAGL